MNEKQVDAYLARIGAKRPLRPDAESLRELQQRHLYTVPFENLSIHLGEPIVLEEALLLDKLIRRRRGGFCYELNGSFAALLSALGFQVTLLAARVFGRAGIGPLFDHLTLRVDAPDPWLADVGFGAFSQHPLRLDLAADQDDPQGVFRVLQREHGDLDIHMNGEPAYRIEPRPRVLADFEPTSWWHQTSPQSHFTQGTVCSLLTETGRITLRGRTLIRTVGSQRYEEELGSEAEVLDAYRELFGMALDRVPSLRSP